MAYQAISLHIDGPIARITLNRPTSANAMNIEMMKELLHVAIALDENTSIRAVAITGKGDFFCAGGDLASFAKADHDLPAFLKQATTVLHAAITRFAHMKKPVVTIINGPAAGAGFSLAIMSDYTIASESVKFSMAYTGAGLTPDGSSSYYLPRLIGEKRARELMMTNRTLSAAEALDWGMINEVVSDNNLNQAAETVLSQFAKGPTQAYGTIKELLLNSGTSGLETQMEHESRAISGSAHTADGLEGINAFLNKRKPEFIGK